MSWFIAIENPRRATKIKTNPKTITNYFENFINQSRIKRDIRSFTPIVKPCRNRQILRKFSAHVQWKDLRDRIKYHRADSVLFYPWPKVVVNEGPFFKTLNSTENGLFSIGLISCPYSFPFYWNYEVDVKSFYYPLGNENFMFIWNQG